MANEPAHPISINIQRQSSTSPRQQTSNLTSALQSTGSQGTQASAMNSAAGNSGRAIPQARKDSITMGGLTPQFGSAAMPISVSGRSQPRRESIAGSMMNGMSWGGVSMNSWIRDDIMMQGSSPYAPAFQSPSFHSSSYLPKLEANFMKDFTCCGLTLPSLHDLLQHFEEAHAQQVPPSMAAQYTAHNGGNMGGTGSAAPASNGAAQGNQTTAPASTAQPSSTIATSVLPMQQPASAAKVEESRQEQPSQDMESVEDMEMDDVNGTDDFSGNPTGYAMPETEQFPRRNQFGQPRASAVPPLDLNTLNNPFQGIRQSQPNTPVSGGRAYHNNPTVSSVNTPTLSAHPLQQHFRTTPDSSAPGTPGELDPDFVGNLGNMTMDNAAFMSNQADFGNANFGFGQSELLDLCIDDPAKRLFSPHGATNQQNPQNRLGNAQYGPNSEIARRIREQQRKVGLPDTVSGINGEEPKPFRCPVIGCEKAYKNQNGLKYHKSHGHNNQQLHENADGTFSIVDPATLSPYPGTLGMEKEKPYKCEVCGKRYKNLNGLKYHKTHSPPCNPDLKLSSGAPINATALNANVAGAGLPGIEEM